MDGPGSIRRKLRNLQLNNLINGYQKFTDLNALLDLIDPPRDASNGCLSQAYTESCIVGVEHLPDDLERNSLIPDEDATSAGQTLLSHSISANHMRNNETPYNAIACPLFDSQSDCRPVKPSSREAMQLHLPSNRPNNPIAMTSGGLTEQICPRSPIFHFDDLDQAKVTENVVAMTTGGREPDITFLLGQEELLTLDNCSAPKKQPVFFIPDSNIDMQEKEDPQMHIGAKLYSTVKRRMSKTLAGYSNNARSQSWDYDSSDEDIPDDYIPMFCDQSPEDFWERDSLADLYMGDRICGIFTGGLRKSRNNSANALNECRAALPKTSVSEIMSSVVEEASNMNGDAELVLPKFIEAHRLDNALPDVLPVKENTN